MEKVLFVLLVSIASVLAGAVAIATIHVLYWIYSNTFNFGS